MDKLAKGKGLLFMKKKHVFTILVLCYIAFIFSNSMTPASESSQQSGSVLQLVRTVAQALHIDGPWLTEHLIRKTAHFAEYALLGLLLWNCIRLYDIAGRGHLLLQAWLGMLVPLTDETIQLFAEGRSGQISDVWLDISGVCAGTLSAFLVLRIIGSRKRSADGKRTADEKQAADGKE